MTALLCFKGLLVLMTGVLIGAMLWFVVDINNLRNK